MIKNKNKEELIAEWKSLRGAFFNVYNEDIEKFRKKYEQHALYDSVCHYLDKSFKEVNQIAEEAIDLYLNKN
jgi:hypothetical protein